MPLHEQELPSSVITTFSSYSLIHSEKEKEKKKKALLLKLQHENYLLLIP